MSRSHIFATFMFSALSMGLSVQVVSASSRADVSSGVQASCTSDDAACLKAVNDQLASLRCEIVTDARKPHNCGCSVGALDVARGLADATTAISKVNARRATIIAETVAKNGVACAQVAFGAELDGTGTAAIAIPNNLDGIGTGGGTSSSILRNGVAGSAG